MTESWLKKLDGDIERLQKKTDVTETERWDEDGQSDVWMMSKRTNQRGKTGRMSAEKIKT